jgi:hypothetical protein
MPFDFAEKKRNESNRETRRIYVCESGNIILETKHFRQSFSPKEFVRILREIRKRDLQKRNLPIIRKQIKPMFCVEYNKLK